MTVEAEVAVGARVVEVARVMAVGTAEEVKEGAEEMGRVE